MTKQLLINGEQKFMGVTIPIIEGGFGQNQKCVLVKDVAIIHEVEIKYINKLINNNISRFNSNDLINLLSSSEELRKFAEINGLIGSNRTKDVFILSERGYTKLVSMMDNSNNKKWEIMDKFIEEYFSMRQIIQSNEQLKANLLLSIYNGGVEAVGATKELLELEKKPLQEKIEEDRPFVALAKKRLDKNGLISITDANKTFERKRGEITKWAKAEGYLHKTNVEVNKKGEDYFRVYDSKGYKCIGITEKGLTLIDEHFKPVG